jgi:S1-C subfamily serine protease
MGQRPVSRAGRRGTAVFLAAALIVALVALAFAALSAAGCANVRSSTTSIQPGSTAGTAAPGVSVSAGSMTSGSSSSSTSSSGTPGTTAAALPSPGGLASPAQAVASKLGPSVVHIAVSSNSGGLGLRQQQYAAQGSGVIYTNDGMIITNNHVVVDLNDQPVTNISVTLATGEILKARIIGRDPLTDLAVIKVDGLTSLPAAAFSKGDPTVGEYAVAIGSPLGYENSVTLGIVSGLSRSIDQATGAEALALIDLIQTDAAISPGNSGGALADASGQVIGINVAYLPPGQTGAENVGFAIPSVTVTATADQIIKTGKATHVYLGVSTRTVTPDLQQEFKLSTSSGALIADVSANTPAAKAGLKQGDIITKIDQSNVTTGADVLIALRSKNPGDTVQVTINRDGQTMTVPAVVAERPAGM